MKRRLSLVLVFTLVLFPLTLLAQQQTASPPATPSGEAPGHVHPSPAVSGEGQEASQEDQGEDSDAMMTRCGAMMAQASNAMDKINDMEKTLDDEVAAMSSAQGQDKVDAMAKVITTMAEQRKQMREMLGKLHHGMMFQMMAQKRMGGMQGKKMMCDMGRMKMRHGKGMQMEEDGDTIIIITK